MLYKLVEALVIERNLDWEQLDLAVLEEIWQEVKGWRPFNACITGGRKKLRPHLANSLDLARSCESHVRRPFHLNGI